jgi:RNA polymerase sigma-70 factor (ECF subfamily)
VLISARGALPFSCSGQLTLWMRSHPDPAPNEEPYGPSPETLAAFTCLYQQQFAAVYRYFYHQTGHIQDTEDLTGTTFHRALSRFEQYQPELGSRPAWLFGVAHNCLREHGRRRRQSAEQLPPELLDPQPLPESQLLSAERAASLHRAIRELPAGQRHALTLRFFAGLRASEVAAVLGRSEGAVKMLVRRAVLALRDCSSLEDWR